MTTPTMSNTHLVVSLVDLETVNKKLEMVFVKPYACPEGWYSPISWPSLQLLAIIVVRDILNTSAQICKGQNLEEKLFFKNH